MKVKELRALLEVFPENAHLVVVYRSKGETILDELETVSINGNSPQLNTAGFQNYLDRLYMERGQTNESKNS